MDTNLFDQTAFIRAQTLALALASGITEELADRIPGRICAGNRHR
ncbi:hypothetical protein [Paenibacillus sp. GCM10023250]